MKYSEDDVASNVMELLSASSTWVLVRHQWLIGKMRSILTGEHAPEIDSLYHFDETLLSKIDLPENLMTDLVKSKEALEKVWIDTTKINHPLSGLSLFEQLNAYQHQAHLFLLEAKEFNQQLWHELTMRDALTGAWSRLTLKSSLTQEQSRAKRHQSECTIALLDQDKFKKINDQWGHSAGDAVLAETAKIIQQNLRPTDKLFRYGGDEWLILMPSTNSDLAQSTMTRIQEVIAKHTFEVEEGKHIHSSFSFGIAECADFNNTADWIAAADQDLYCLKTVTSPTQLGLAHPVTEHSILANAN